jgi:hypothetical protein
MKKSLSDRQSSSNSVESNGKSSQRNVEFDYNSSQKEQIHSWQDPQWVKENQEHSLIQENWYKSFHQHYRQPTRRSAWGRIPQWAMVGTLFLGTAIATLTVLDVPLPSIKLPQPLNRTQQPSVPKTSLQPQPMPTAPLPEQVLPPSVTPLPELPPLPVVPVPTSPTPNSLPENQRKTVSVSPTPAPITNPTVPKLSTAPSPSANTAVLPPPLPAVPPLPPLTPAAPPAVPPLKPSPCSQLKPSACSQKVADNVAPPTGEADKNTQLDNIPQIAEARNYLREHWKPAKGLQQKLEYNVLLNKDGSIERIIPLANTAANNIDSTSIPRPGEPFVSPVQGGRSTMIHVVFSPDGNVKTSLESIK